MNFMNVLERGYRVTLMGEDGDWSGTIGKVTDEGNFTLLRNGRSPGPEQGREYYMICVRENGIHRFRVKILRTDDLAIAAEDYCQYTGDYVRMQRRDAFRCPITLDVKLRKIEPEDSEPSERPWSQTKTVNISETGMCVSLSSNFERGDLIECNLYINTCGIDAVLPGIPATIVWTMDLLRGKNPLLCGVQFEQIDRKSRDVLLRLVTLGQRKILAR